MSIFVHFCTCPFDHKSGRLGQKWSWTPPNVPMYNVYTFSAYSCMVGSDFYAKLVDNAGDFSRTGEGLLIVVSMYTDLVSYNIV